MTKSKEILEKAKGAGLIEEKEFIKFKGTGKHIVKFIEDKVINSTNFRTGKPEEKVKYIFEEDGKKKFYETAIFRIDPETNKKKLSHFVQKMADFEYGDLLEMEYKPIPGTPRGFIEINKVKESEEETQEIVNEDEIPVIEDEEINPDEIPF